MGQAMAIMATAMLLLNIRSQKIKNRSLVHCSGTMMRKMSIDSKEREIQLLTN